MPTATLTGIPTEKVVKIQYHYQCMLSQIFAWNSVVRHSWLGILQGLICTHRGKAIENRYVIIHRPSGS